MILKGIRLRTASGITRTIRHIQNGKENESVAFLRGTPGDIRDMHHDATSHGSTYAVRHWIVAPHEKMTRQQLEEVLNMLAEEFEFDPVRAVVVEHQKRRATSNANDLHWHVLVGEVDPTTGRILKSSFDRVKHELISRVAEFEFGHPFIPGKHTKAVIRGLRARKLDCLADRLEAIFDPSASPVEAFSHSQHQEKKRLGFDLPGIRQSVKRAVSGAVCRSDLENRLSVMGLAVREGQKPGTWIVVNAADDILIGALHRLAGRPKSEINGLMATPDVEMPQHTTADDFTSPPVACGDCTIPDTGIPRSPILEEVLSKLHDLEQSAVRDLERDIPEFEPSHGMREAAHALRTARADFNRAHDQRFDLEWQLSNTPPARWWGHLFGIAQRRRALIEVIEAELEKVQSSLRSKELAISAARLREVRAEKAARVAYAALVRDISQKHKSAKHSLAVIEEARVILAERPDMAATGFNLVFSNAKARVRRKNEAADHLMELEAVP